MDNKTLYNKGWCPVFSGFYGTIWEPDLESDIDNYFTEEMIKEIPIVKYSYGILKEAVIHKTTRIKLKEQLDNRVSEFAGVGEVINNNFDNSTYEAEACKAIFIEIKEKLIELGYISGGKFEEVRSPKEYNFNNDSINCTWEVNQKNINKIKLTIKENQSSFESYLKEKYTSYSGFMSHYSSDIKDWQDWEDILNDKHRFSSILEWLFLVEGVDEMELYYGVTGEIFLSHYIDWGKVDKDIEENLLNSLD